MKAIIFILLFLPNISFAKDELTLGEGATIFNSVFDSIAVMFIGLFAMIGLLMMVRGFLLLLMAKNAQTIDSRKEAISKIIYGALLFCVADIIIILLVTSAIGESDQMKKSIIFAFESLIASNGMA